MVPESACLPVPSEITLLSAGYGVHEGWFGLPAAVGAAVLGNLCGSLIAYWIGRRGTLASPPRWARSTIGSCERLLERHGDAAVFIARLLPLARSFVSLPAGRFGFPLGRFLPLTIAGCAIWSAAFVFAGALAGTAWQAVASTASRVSLLVLLALLIGAVAAERRSRSA